MKFLPLVGAILVFAAAIPMVLGLVPPNSMIGFRTPSTMSSPESWYAANVLMGWYLMVGQGVGILSYFLLERFTGPSGNESRYLLLVPTIAPGVAAVAGYLHYANFLK